VAVASAGPYANLASDR